MFTGDKNQSRPYEYHHQGIDTSIHFRFRSYHIFDHSQEELLAMDNIFALVVLACQKAIGEGKVADAELGDDRLTIAKALLSHEYEHDRIVSFLFFLKNFLYINDVEINRIFDKQIVQLSEKEFDMGVIEIVKKHAREDNTREIIKHLISETEFSDEQASRITGVNVDFIRELRSELEQEKQE